MGIFYHRQGTLGFFDELARILKFGSRKAENVGAPVSARGIRIARRTWENAPASRMRRHSSGCEAKVTWIRAKRAVEAAIVAAALLPVGCRKEATLRVEAGASASNFAFLIGTPRSGERIPVFEGIRVERFTCGSTMSVPGEAVWLVTAPPDGGLRPGPSRVAYGETISGFTTRVGPNALSPGCYAASILAPGYAASTSFRVGENLAVTEL